MTSNPQSAPLAWDGISQKVGETDSLLSNTQTRPAAKWQRYLALMLLVTMTAITLALGAILWQLTTKVDQLSRLQVSTSTASETNPFPFVVNMPT